MPPLEAVVKILGVEDTFAQTSWLENNPQHLSAIIRQGLPPSSAERIAQYYGLSKKKVSELIGISVRTLERYLRDNKSLDPVPSDRLLRYACIAAHAEEVFEAPQVAQNWLKRPNHALGEKFR